MNSGGYITSNISRLEASKYIDVALGTNREGRGGGMGMGGGIVALVLTKTMS